MFAHLFMAAMALLFAVQGLLVWKKQKITLIHSYHYANVRDEDKKPYTERMGKALLVMAAGLLLTTVVNYLTADVWGWVCFAVCFAWSSVLMWRAQKRYNGGLF